MKDPPAATGRNPTEQAFLQRLAERCEAVNQPFRFDVWTFLPALVVTLDISDHRRANLRTLRVDLDGHRLVAGIDPTHQINQRELNRSDPDYVEMLGSDPAQLADSAYNWFRQQAARPIERRDWHEGGQTWVLWALQDDGRPLVSRRVNRPSRPPDRIEVLPAVPL